MKTTSENRRLMPAVLLAAAIGLIAGLYLGSFAANKPGVSRADWPSSVAAQSRTAGPKDHH